MRFLTKFAFVGMQRAIVLPLFVAVAGCTTTNLQSGKPLGVYASAQSREVVSDCLLNRLASKDLRGKITRGPTETIVTFDTGLATVWVFNIRDDGSGSITEAHRLSSLTAGRTNAETCF